MENSQIMEAIMNLYSKISLLALLAAGTTLGMEIPPRLKAPAQSAAAQALNQPMIKVFSDTHQIDSIQRNYLETSETLKNMLHDLGTGHALVLPESMIEDYLALKDLLMYEYRLIAGTTDENTVINLLKLKTDQQLATIINACQRLDVNLISPIAINALTELLLTNNKKQQCLENGSYNLPWTIDTEKLVAAAMIQKGDFRARLATYFTFLQLGSLEYGEIRSAFNNTHHTNKNWNTFANTPLTQYFFDDINKEIQDLVQLMQPIPESRRVQTIVSHTIVPANDAQKYNITYWHVIPAFLNYAQKLKPAQIALLHYLMDQAHMPEGEFHRWRGIDKISKTLPKYMQTLLNKSEVNLWISRHPILAGAAISSAGIATAWLGYKYFSKK
jgi:hypothetical protein